MRFDLPESIQAMREGHKTMTRRRNKYWLRKKRRSRITIVHQGRYLGTAMVMGTWTHQLGEVTTVDARAEGYANLWDFVEAWRGLYGSWDDDEEVCAIAFTDIRWREAEG